MNVLQDNLTQMERELKSLDKRISRIEPVIEFVDTIVPIVDNVVSDFTTGDLVVTWDAAQEYLGVVAYHVSIVKTYT